MKIDTHWHSIPGQGSSQFLVRRQEAMLGMGVRVSGAEEHSEMKSEARPCASL